MSGNIICCYCDSGHCLNMAKSIAKVLGDTDIALVHSFPVKTDATEGKRVGFCVSVLWRRSTRGDRIIGLAVQKARNKNNLWAKFPQGIVVVLNGRQPACVLRLAVRKVCSESLVHFLTFSTTSA